jgi:pimeloyl-ACP methyl ester carboxylesterase
MIREGKVALSMSVETVLSRDGVRLKYAHCGLSNRPCIALIMPFGLRVDVAAAFFRFYQPRYDVVTWESRLILDSSAREVRPEDFAIINHVYDLASVLRACRVSRAFLVGYCSGAGIGLAAASRYPQLFSSLTLVHGDYMLLGEESCTTPFSEDIDSLLSLSARSDEHARQVFEKVTSDRRLANQNLPEGIDTPFTQLPYLRRYALNYLAYKATDFKKLARSVTHNTLLLTGDRDAQANVASARRIQGIMRNADLHVDPDADHYGILREDSKTLATIWNYLGEQLH